MLQGDVENKLSECLVGSGTFYTKALDSTIAGCVKTLGKGCLRARIQIATWWNELFRVGMNAFF